MKPATTQGVSVTVQISVTETITRTYEFELSDAEFEIYTRAQGVARGTLEAIDSFVEGVMGSDTFDLDVLAKALITEGDPVDDTIEYSIEDYSAY